MNSNRRKELIAGILIITGMVAGIFSVVPAIDSPDYLIEASANANQVIIGAIFQFIMSIAYLGIAITLYPILRKFNDTLAVGYLSFRIVAVVFIFVGVIFLLLLLTLSQEFIKVAPQDSSYYQILGDLLRTGRDLVNHVAMILALNLGNLMFYILLYQTKLIPRWLSSWGLVGPTLTILASLLVMFHTIDIITPVYLVLNLPMALLEIVLAIWLIAKGFDSTIIANNTEKG